MFLTCLDLEGVLTPEIWICVADAFGIPELKRTTRDEPDYDKLMKGRIAILDEKGITMSDIRRVISGIEPLPGALEFLNGIREFTQAVIISDTFDVFGQPLMKKLGFPLLFCHELIIDRNDRITGWKYRLDNPKAGTVHGLKALGFKTIVAGDSFNDLGMIRAADKGILFRTTDAIRNANPDIPALETYDELTAVIRSTIGS